MATTGSEPAARRTPEAHPGSPVRPRSPAPQYGADGLDGSGAAAGARRYVDYRMDPAPSWNGEWPEQQYREYARKLKLWLIEARERLPSALIGKRILDAIPYGSRLSSLVSHLSVEEITSDGGWQTIVSCIEEAHDYLKVAKLEQAFTEAVFKGRRKHGQSIAAFLTVKKASFAELRKQGLDLLATPAGEHLLGHLVLRQGGFTADQQQRIRVLTDGSIEFKKVEEAIRKIFGDGLDDASDHRGQSYWLDGTEDGDDWSYQDSELYDQNGEIYHQNGEIYYQNDETYFQDTENSIFQDLLESGDDGEVYICLDEPMPAMLEEDEAVSYCGELLSYVFGETSDRWFRKGKGKGKNKGKSKGKGKGKPGAKGFGVYGTGMERSYLDHRRALQQARSDRGFGRGAPPQRPHTSIGDIKARTRCHQCKQLGHWSRECPQRRRAPSPISTRPGSTPSSSAASPKLSTNMFFLSEPDWNQGPDSGISISSATYFVESGGSCDPEIPLPKTGKFFEELNELDRPVHLSEPEQYMESSFLSFTFASTQGEPRGCALVDTAAQHGLVGEGTLMNHDALLRDQYKLRVQVTNEPGGTVRGVCGSEQITKVAYVPLGISGKSGVLRVQVVPGDVPFLVPAYLLSELGAVIDMHACIIAYTAIGAVQRMTRRSTGHVEINICEFGNQWSVPQHYDFLKSEVWEPNPAPPSGFSIELLDGAHQACTMAPSLASLCAALLLCAVRAGAGELRADHHSASIAPSTTVGCTTRNSRAEEDHDVRGLCRAASPHGRAPRTGEIPDSGSPSLTCVPSPRDEAWCQFGLGLGEVSSMSPGGADPKASTEPAAALERGADLPKAGLRDTDGETKREGDQEGHQGFGENGQSLHTSNELYETSSVVSFGGTAGVPGDGHWDPAFEDVRPVPERVRADGGERSGAGRVELVEAGCSLCTSDEPSGSDASLSTLSPRRPSLVHLCRGEQGDVDVQRRDPWMPVPVAELCRPPDFGHRTPPVCGVSAGSTSECASPRSRSSSLSSMRRHDADDGVERGPERTLSERGLQPSSSASEPVMSKYQFVGWLEDASAQLPGLMAVLGNVVTSQSVVCSYFGDKVPDHLPVRLRCPLGTRVVASNPEPGIWNLLNIDRSASQGYDLGKETKVYVIQEFVDDFLDYVKDQDLEPIEVTMDKHVKKRLGDSLTSLTGSLDQYFDLWEEAASSGETLHESPTPVSLDCELPGTPDELPPEVLSQRLPVQEMTQFATKTGQQPKLPYNMKDLGLPRSPRDTTRLQSDLIPYDFELTGLCRDLQQFGYGNEVWRDHYGQAMLVTMCPKKSLVPPIGPGNRHLRWSAVMVSPGEWRWMERGGSGPLPPGLRDGLVLVVVYRWNPPAQVLSDTAGKVVDNFVTTFDLTDREKRDVLRCHVNLGHPHAKEFARLLRAAGSRQDVIQYVLREFECPGCVREKRPPTRLPAATPRTYDFNVIVGVDLLFVHGLNSKADHPILNITCLGTLYSTFGLVDPLARTAVKTWEGFTRLWLRTFGAPQYLMFDEGREFTGSAFQEGMERHGIIPLEVSRQAPFSNGIVERRGGLFKEVYYRTKELMPPKNLPELEALIFEVSWALQTLVNRSGFSPAQRVLGRQPTLALDTLADQREYHLSTRARLARPRQEIAKLHFDNFDKGEPVAVWRHGKRGNTAKVGPCFVVLQEGQTIWVTRRGQLWRCHVGQVYKMAESEKAGIEAVPLDLLEAKTRLRYDSEKMRYVDVSQEVQLGGDGQGSVGPPDGREPLTEIPVPDPPVLSEGVDDSVYVRPPDGREPLAEIPVPDPVVVPILDLGHEQSGVHDVEDLGHEQSGVHGSRASSARSRSLPPGESIVEGTSESASSSSSSSTSSSSTPRAPQGRAEWPPAGSGTVLKKWSRFDANPSRFRTSTSKGPMWSDVVQRVTIDNDTNEVLKRENINGNERPQDLHRHLPRPVRSLRTVLVYKKVTGHPDPGTELTSPDQPERDPLQPEDARLFDQRVKRGLEEVGGRKAKSPAPVQRSRGR